MINFFSFLLTSLSTITEAFLSSINNYVFKSMSGTPRIHKVELQSPKRYNLFELF